MIMQPPNEDLVQLVISATPYEMKDKYKDMRRTVARQLIGLGVTQVIIGVVCIALNAGDIAMPQFIFYNLSFVGHGFWNGIPFIVTGSFVIAGGTRKTCCKVVTFQVFSIISSVLSSALFGIAIGSVAYSSSYSDARYYIPQGLINTSITLESLMASLAILACITTIWAASLACCQISCSCCSCCRCCVRCCCSCCVSGCCRCCSPAHQETKELVFTWASKNQEQPMITIKAQHQPIIMANSDNMIMANPQQPMIMTPSQQTFINPHRQTVIFPQVTGPYYIALSADGANHDPYTDLQIQNQESTVSETGPLGSAQLAPPYYTALSQVRSDDAPYTGIYSQEI